MAVPELARALVVPVRAQGRGAQDAAPVQAQVRVQEPARVPEPARAQAQESAQGQAQAQVPGASAQAVPDAAELAQDAGALVSVVQVWEAQASVVAAWLVPVLAVRAWAAVQSALGTIQAPRRRVASPLLCAEFQ
jgi:hypothetical protein